MTVEELEAKAKEIEAKEQELLKKEEELKNSKGIDQDKLDSIIKERIKREREKSEKLLNEERKKKEDEKKTEVQLISERLEEIERNNQALKKELEDKEKAQLEANTRNEFFKKMVADGVDTDVAKTLSETTKKSAIDSFDYSKLIKKTNEMEVNSNSYKLPTENKPKVNPAKFEWTRDFIRGK